MDFVKLSDAFGRPVCVVLYSWFSYLAAKRKPLPLLILLGLHTFEYFYIGKDVAEENGLSKAAGIANCLAFGFTWWLPIKKK